MVGTLYCQECRAPLTPHVSIQDISPAAYSLVIPGESTTRPSLQTTLSSRSYHGQDQNATGKDRESYADIAQDSQQPLIKRSIPGAVKHSSPLAGPSNHFNPGESFVVLSDSVLHAPTAHSHGSSTADVTHKTSLRPEDEAAKHKLKTSKLFDVISARSDIDHPICFECTELLIESLTARLASSVKERDAYQMFLKRAQNEIPSEDSVKSTKRELGKLRTEEQLLMDELEQWEQKKADLDAEMAQLHEEARKIDLEEEEFWRERNSMAQELEEYQNERDSVNLRYDHDAKQLEKLQRTNVYNDTYLISHDGHFATINGLRLGKMGDQVDWPEINAAWGQTLLLLHTIAERLSFTFEGYRFKLQGSTSKIEKVEQRSKPSSSASASANPTTNNDKTDVRVQTLELYSSNSIPMGHLFAHRKFDGAMVALLDCIKQLGDFVQKRDPSLVWPYKIDKDKIGEVSLRLTFNQDEAWTKACKHTLTCAKFLLAHASNIQSLMKRQGVQGTSAGMAS